MSTEIKNTLFRFVTMRSPELSEEKNKDKRFVYRSAGVKGVFDTAVANRDNKTKWEAMKGVNFTPASEATIKASVREELYDFAIWIARNKYSATDAELMDNVPANYGTLKIDEPLLWNNLFYQVISQKDFYVKELIMQLLVAYHVCHNFDEENKELRKLLINAKVVLPKELFIEGTSGTTAPMARLAIEAERPEEDEEFVSLPSEEMQRVQTVALSNINIERHKKLKKELQRAEQSYRKEYQDSFDRAQADYENEIKPILDTYNREVEAEKAKWCSIRDPKIPYDPTDPCNTPPVIQKPKLPEFRFEFRNEIDLEYLESVLSAPAFDTLLEVLEIETVESPEKAKGGIAARIISGPSGNTGASYLNVFDLIDGGIGSNTQVIVGNTPSQGNTSVSIGGVVIPTTGNTTPLVLPFSHQICPKIYSSNANGGTYVNFDLSFGVPDTSWQILGVKTIVEKNSGEKITKTIFNQSRTGNNYMLTNLHNDALTVGDFYYVMKNLTVEITFTNGAKKSVTSDFYHTLNCMSGRMLTITDPKPDTTPTNPSVPVTGADGSFIPSGFGVKQLGIADYKKVDQTIQGYVEGEVAAIENIMAREYKEKATRRLRRSENTTTTSSESEREQLSDTTNTSRFEMQSEVAKVLQEDKDFSAGATFGAEWGGAPGTKFSLGANVNMATHSSKEESTRQAVNQAKEVTERAMERIVTKVKQERIEKIIEEFEENNKHGFDNTKGDKHVVGVYRWVDKVFKNQIFNYGKRLMFEFMVPEPSKLHLLGMAENPTGTKLTIPDDPRTFVDPIGTSVPLKLKDYAAVNDATLKYWGSKFNVEISNKPEDVIHCGASFNLTHDGTSLARHEGASGSGKIEIPEGYMTTDGYINFTAAKDNDNQVYSGMLVSLGKVNKVLASHQGGIEKDFSFSLAGYVQSVPVSYTMSNFFHGNVNASVRCQLTNDVKVKWQQDTFKAIIDAYEDALVEYEQKLAEENAKGGVIKEANPGFYRQIENMVLRKNCISYIVDQNATAKRTYGKDMSKPLAPGVKRVFGNHEIKVDANLDDYAAFVKFMEQAFEWDIMSYNFYPYYWGAREDWGQLYQHENNDPLFRSFMQAGMARVIVTVRPGFEEAVSYYMQTGQIWNGGEVPVIEDKLFLSIVDELRQPEGQKEGKAWATRLPTALTILQADSIGLKVDKALPYDEDLSDFEDPTSVPHSPNFHITGAQMNGGTSKTVEFSYEGMDSYAGNTIEYYDTHNGFPRTFTCMGEEIVIERDANWSPDDSPEVIYKKLAEQLSLISGISASQFSSEGNASGIKFIVDTDIVGTFTFEKKNPYDIPDPEFDLIKIYFANDTVRVASPSRYLQKISDANKTKLTSAEVNTLLPISRFSL